MNVSEAVETRKSIRAFLDTPVSDDLLREVLTKASRAPSGGNVQPWKIYIVNGEVQERFKGHVFAKLPETPMGEGAEYSLYPTGLKDPYRSYRFEVGEDMYALLGIARDDKPSRLNFLANNYMFFGAPAAIFCFVDREMGSPQWSDLGMYLQTAMLLFEEAGLNTCAQEFWSNWPKTVAEFVGAPDELMLFCGMAIGHKDPEHPVNQLESKRASFEEFATFVQ